MRPLFYKFTENIGGFFRRCNIFWQLIAAALTYCIVLSGLDWLYFVSLQGTALARFLFPAVILGGIAPVVVPLAMLLAGKIRRSAKTVNAAWGVGQAALLGWLLSSFYKMFTGRIPPPRIPGFSLPVAHTDVSGVFRFGILRGGIFWGWPSSHTTVAFAVALAFVMLYPKNKTVAILALAYAFYVGIGVSMSIHWLSDAVAGAIFGTIVGITVGRSFGERQEG